MLQRFETAGQFVRKIFGSFPKWYFLKGTDADASLKLVEMHLTLKIILLRKNT